MSRALVLLAVVTLYGGLFGSVSGQNAAPPVATEHRDGGCRRPRRWRRHGGVGALDPLGDGACSQLAADPNSGHIAV